jgi:hypothetical protein
LPEFIIYNHHNRCKGQESHQTSPSSHNIDRPIITTQISQQPWLPAAQTTRTPPRPPRSKRTHSHIQSAKTTSLAQRHSTFPGLRQTIVTNKPHATRRPIPSHHPSTTVDTHRVEDVKPHPYNPPPRKVHKPALACTGCILAAPSEQSNNTRQYQPHNPISNRMQRHLE